MTKTARPSRTVGPLLLALVLAACGDSSGSDEIEPLATPVEGTWGSESVALLYGFAASIDGLESIWSSGVDPSSTPLAVTLSTAEVSCDTDLGAGNPPAGYTLVLLFPGEQAGATSDEQNSYSFMDGWINAGGAGGSMAGTLTAVDDATLSGSIDLQDDQRSFVGEFTVPRC